MLIPKRDGSFISFSMVFFEDERANVNKNGRIDNTNNSTFY